MDSYDECIIAGGPQHGMVYRRPRNDAQPAPLGVVTDDGQLCKPAARKYGSRVVLLHPQATGEQFLTILAA